MKGNTPSGKCHGGKRSGAGRKAGPPKVRHSALVIPRTQSLLEQVAFLTGDPHGVVLDRIAEALMADPKLFEVLFDISPPPMVISSQSVE